MKQSYLYIRVSTDEQAERGYSLRSQEEILRRYCELNNIFIKGVFIEDHSAKTFNRPEFTKLLFSIKKHKGIVDSILFIKWDRFSRNAGDAYGMISTLNKLGVEPQAIEQPLDLSIPENKMMLAFYLAAPEVENDRKSLNVIQGMRRAAKEGRWMNMAPRGYKNVNDNGKKLIVPVEHKAAIIKDVFEAVAKNIYSIESIRTDANKKGLQCSRTGFYTMIRNPVYCGKILLPAYKQEPEALIAGIHQPIISEELFYRTQEALKSKKRSSKIKMRVQDKFPLRGFLICPGCKKLLTGSTSAGNGGKYDYYHCTQKQHAYFNTKEVHTSFTAELQKWKPNKAIVELFKVVVAEVFSAAKMNVKDELKLIQQQLQELQERSIKARNLLLSEAIDASDYKSIKSECEQETVLLQSRLVELSKDPADIKAMMEKAVNLLAHVDEIYMDADTFKKREIISSIFPHKLEYTKSGFRTTQINEAVKLIFNMSAAFNASPNHFIKHIQKNVQFGYPKGTDFEPFLHDLRTLSNLAA